MSTNDEEATGHQVDKKPVREINVFSFAGDGGIDDDYDFRPMPLPADAEEAEVPKGSSATEPVDDSVSSQKSAPVTETTVPAAKVKSQAQKAS